MADVSTQDAPPETPRPTAGFFRFYRSFGSMVGNFFDWVTRRQISTPTILQMEAVECGAAALAIVLAYYKKWVPLEQLRVMCGVSRDGSTARGIVEAARQLGMHAKGCRYDLNELAQLQVPAIIFWKFNHFVVYAGKAHDGFFINDPATGPRKVPFDEFDRSYTGVTLVIKPGETFQRSGSRPGIWPLLAPWLKIVLPGVTMFTILGLLMIIPGLVQPAFNIVFLDHILVGGTKEWLRPLLFAMGIAIFFQAFMTWLSGTLTMRLHNKLALSASSKFLWHLFRLPHQFFTQRHSGDILSRLDSNEEVADIVANQLGGSVIAFASMIFYGILMVLLDPLLTLVVLGLTIVTLTVNILAARIIRDVSLRMEVEEAKNYSSAINSIQAIETIKATGSEAFAFNQWAGYHAQTINTEQRLARLDMILSIFPIILTSVAGALVLGLGSFRVIDGTLTIGGLVAFQGLTGGFTGPLNALVGFILNLEEVRASMSRVRDVLDYPEDPRYNREAPVNTFNQMRFTGKIELRDVTFGFNQLNPPLIEGLNITIEPGARVALVGGSGSGKSTIAKLIGGMYEPWSGDVLFDGKSYQDFPRQLITSSIGWVDQEIFLFEGSILDNITMWDTSIPDERIDQACRDALIHDDIMKRPGGYDAKINDGGGNVSGGQAQRIEIARRLAMEPSILILDEATSALDPLVEHQIDLNLRRRGCTCIIVAHRLSTVRDADEIIVLDGGKVVERGTHHSLVSDRGFYHDLVEF